MLSSYSYQSDKKKDYLSKTISSTRDNLDMREAKQEEVKQAFSNVGAGTKLKKAMELASSLHPTNFYKDNMKGKTLH